MKHTRRTNYQKLGINHRNYKNINPKMLRLYTSINHIQHHESHNDAQMLIIMGIALAISLVILTSIPIELANLGIEVPTGQSSSLLSEFGCIKETFGTALNYNLVHLSIDPTTGATTFNGTMKNILTAFNQTRNTFYLLELQHDIIFDAVYNNYWYSDTSDTGHYVYQVSITLSLSDKVTDISEIVTYSILCKPYILS